MRDAVTRAARAERRIKRRADLSSRWGRVLAWLDLLFIDHGLLRLAYTNAHALSPLVRRAAQPSPLDIARFAREGVKTVVNLRGASPAGHYVLEAEACRRHGLALVDFKLSSRRPVRRETIHAARKLFREIEYPAVFHCKSGADRAGLMSVLYLLCEADAPVSDARAQLALRYGHVRHGPTGMLDHVFETYLAERARTGVDFWTWLDTGYDPRALKKTFRPSGLAGFLVDKVLRRE